MVLNLLLPSSLSLLNAGITGMSCHAWLASILVLVGSIFSLHFSLTLFAFLCISKLTSFHSSVSSLFCLPNQYHPPFPSDIACSSKELASLMVPKASRGQNGGKKLYFSIYRWADRRGRKSTNDLPQGTRQISLGYQSPTHLWMTLLAPLPGRQFCQLSEIYTDLWVYLCFVLLPLPLINL